MVKEGGISGALGGLLLGALFFAPFLGLAIGAGLGAFAGTLADYGIDDQFVKELAAKLPPGGSAIVVVVSKGDPDKVVAQVGAFGGEIIQTSLSDEQKARLREALSVKPARR